MTTPTISILSIVRNEERFISGMIESLQAQDFTDWELVIVDDGSNDWTRPIIEACAAADDRIRLAGDGSPVGKVRAWNIAWGESRGALVTLMAGDDLMRPGSLRKVCSMLQGRREAKVVLFSKLRMFWTDSERKPIDIPRSPRGSRSGPGITMSRALAEYVFPIPEDLVSDDPWTALVAEPLAEEVFENTSPTVEYRVHAGNSGVRNRTFEDASRGLHERNRAYIRAVELHADILPSDAKSRYRAQWHAEELRYQGRLWDLGFYSDVGVRERVAGIVLGSQILRKIHTRFFHLIVGRRGR